MESKNSPSIYIDAANKLVEEANNLYEEAYKIYDKSLLAAKVMLRSRGEKCFVVTRNKMKTIKHANDLRIFGITIIGLEKGHLVMKACAYTYEFDWYWGCDEWLKARDIAPNCYPILYQEVALNIDESMTKEEAVAIVDAYDKK